MTVDAVGAACVLCLCGFGMFVYGLPGCDMSVVVHANTS